MSQVQPCNSGLPFRFVSKRSCNDIHEPSQTFSLRGQPSNHKGSIPPDSHCRPVGYCFPCRSALRQHCCRCGLAACRSQQFLLLLDPGLQCDHPLLVGVVLRPQPGKKGQRQLAVQPHEERVLHACHDVVGVRVSCTSSDGVTQADRQVGIRQLHQHASRAPATSW